jgi:hypothetical protein
MLEDFGLLTLKALLDVQIREPSFYAQVLERFGKAPARFLRRLQGQDDLGLSWYTPQNAFENEFFPEWERLLETEATQSLLKRIEEIIDHWIARLAARKELMSSLEIRVTPDRRKQRGHLRVTEGSKEGPTTHTILIKFPKATREKKAILGVLEEHWKTLCEKTSSFSATHVDRVQMFSRDFVSESDRQMNLFHPQKEDVSESWNLLVGKINARSDPKDPVELGCYRNFESYVPEQSVEWVPWEEIPDENPSSVLREFTEGPKRPPLMYEVPRHFEWPKQQEESAEKLSDAAQFFRWIEEVEASPIFERIHDPWMYPAVDRTYVRVKDLWVYWDHTRGGAYLHGVHCAT